MIKQYKLRFYNFRLVIFLLAISTFGIILVGSAREDLMTKQLAGVIIGLIIMVILLLMVKHIHLEMIIHGFQIFSGLCTSLISFCF